MGECNHGSELIRYVSGKVVCLGCEYKRLTAEVKRLRVSLDEYVRLDRSGKVERDNP